MLYFVQQFRRSWLQTREHRPKCCTKCNIKPPIGLIPRLLLYKMQHLQALLKNWMEFSGEFSGTAGDDR
nr:hypothetical protein [Paenibacillus ginsengihumi]